ncbi:MAG: hypothetical protein U0V74_13850 [Chitinophagales bacterium]
MRFITLTLCLLCFLGLSAQEKLIKEDSCLRKLSVNLPAHWQLSMADNWIVIQNHETGQSGGKGDTKRGPVSFMFRYEAKWTTEKYQQIKSYNEQLGYAIAELENKYKLKDAINRSTNGILVGINEDENKRIVAYNKEKDQLQKQVVPLPVFNTEKYSLFDTFFNERISSEYYYPEASGTEMINVHASIRNSLLQAN